MNEKNGRNAHHKYAIRGFEWHFPSVVAVAVSAVLFFVLLLHCLFENKPQTTMNMTVSV